MSNTYSRALPEAMGVGVFYAGFTARRIMCAYYCGTNYMRVYLPHRHTRCRQRNGRDTMSITIKSRKLNREITFSIPGGAYVYADLNGKPGTLGVQICSRGHTLGSTLTASEATLAHVASRWMRAYVARQCA